MRIRLLITLAAFTWTFGCGDGSGAAPGTATRDSAGITIVENAAPSWKTEQAWTLSTEPVLAMGVAQGDPDHEFYQVTGAARLSDGTIVVANSGTQQLRFYAADGSLERSVGRKGGGPGEFQMLMTLRALPGDSLLAFDAMNRRMSLFDAAGHHVRDFGATDASNPVPLLVQGRLDDGSYVAQVANMRIGPAMFERKPGPSRDSVYVLHLDTAGRPADTVGLFPGPRSDVQMIEIGGRRLPMPLMIPFSPGTSVAAAGDRVYVGVSDTYEIRVYAPDGGLTALIRRRHEPRHISEQEAARYRDRLAEAVARQANPFAAQLRDAYAKVPYPETMPAFGELVVDRDGNLWVAAPVASPDEERQWSVFDRDGVWLGDVTTPARFSVREIGDAHVLGSVTDEAETERILLYSLDKPGTM